MDDPAVRPKSRHKQPDLSRNVKLVVFRKQMALAYILQQFCDIDIFVL